MMPSPTEPDLRAWRADTVGDSGSWCHSLSESALAAFDQLAGTELSVIEWRPDADLAAALAADIAAIRNALEDGRGFVIVPAGGPGRYSHRQQAVLYWLLGSLLG